MAAEANEAAIVREMFGTGSDGDDEEQEFEDEGEEKYGTSSYGYSSQTQSHSNDVQETDGLTFKGLKNQGATCYLNALLQSLYFTPELREGIYELTPEDLGTKHEQEAKKLDDIVASNKYKLSDEDIAKLTSLGYTTTRAKRALVKAENDYDKAQLLLDTKQVPSIKRILIKLREFFSLLSTAKDGESSVSTKELTDAFGWLSSEVRIQHDAHELNRILIDAIERSLKDTKNASLINKIYLGQMVSRTLCLKCEYCSERTENFLDAIVQVQNLHNLHESLSKQCESEYLVGDNQYFCEKCNAKSDAKRSIAYTKLPNVLTLALNRFIFNLYTMNREKCTSKFEFPLIFDFEPFLDEKLSSKQTHRTKEDEQLLKKANDEYEEEKKRKQDIVDRKKKEEVESKISNMSKGPLAIEAPPGVTNTQITKGTHKEIAPMALPQSTINSNINSNSTSASATASAAGCAPLPSNNVWRNQIPRSRSQEDEDVQRAIAESLGQVYVAPQKTVRTHHNNAVNNNAYNYNNNNNNANINYHINMNMNVNQEAFEAQEKVTYEEAVDILLNGACCFGVYDHKIKQWRSAVFIKNFDETKRLTVRFTQDTTINPSASSDKFLTIKDFPVDCIMKDAARFDVKERDLNDMSNVPKENIEKWVQRKKLNKTTKSKKKKDKEEQAKKEKQEKEKREKEAARIKKEKEDKAKKEKEEREKEKEEKRKEAEAKEKEKEDIKILKQAKEESKEAQKQDKKDTNDADKEEKTEKEEKIEDWSNRKDFSGVSLVGFLCDDGEVIQGDCLRQTPGKIFVHFNTDAAHYGKKYAWIEIPNERICPPPKTRPKPRGIGFSREMTTYAMSGMHEKYNAHASSTTDYGSRDESSIIGGSEWNRKKSKQHKAAPRWKLNEIDININSKHLYALTAVVIHRGTPHAGHYHAYLKDFMKEGKWQKKKNDIIINEEEDKKEDNDDERRAFVSKVCDDKLWYDFNDSSVYRIPCNQVAKQYGGGASYDECAYMLVYRKINKESAKEIMTQPNLKLPKDLEKYIENVAAEKEKERKAKEAKDNEIKIQIVDPSCFSVNKEGKLTMNPFIESLMIKIIRLGREKENIDRVINENKKKDNEEEEKEDHKSNPEIEEVDVKQLYLEKKWPTNMTRMEIHNIVQEHYKQNSIFITCDGRENIDKLMIKMHEKFADIKDIQLHFLSIPSAFEEEAIECKSIDNLFNENIGGNIDDRLYPIYAFDDNANDKNDDEFPYHMKPSKIRDLPFKNSDFMLHSRVCFVWNGSDINSVSFNLQSARTVDLTVKYLTDNTQFIEKKVTVSISASLDNIWSEIKDIKEFEISTNDPVFTLLSTSSSDWPDILYKKAIKYDREFYSRRKFAKLLHHKINPMKRWRSMKNIHNHNNNNNESRNRSNSDPSSSSRSRNRSNSDTFWGEPILCVENASCLPQASSDTIASAQWQESTKFSSILVDDFTQLNNINNVNDEKEEKEEKNPHISCRKLTWKVPKGTSLEKFFEIARVRCSIASDVDLRAFRVFDTQRYLITFPFKFQLKEHKLILERGRYPKYNEIFLMCCLLSASGGCESEFLPVIVERTKSVKYLKQEILKLFNLNPSAYKKYVCFNVTTSTLDRDKCWRDSQTLNSSTLNPSPRIGDRVGIQIGQDVIQKNVVIMSDTRDLSKIDYNINCSKIEQNSGYPYIKQEIGSVGIEADATYETLRKLIYGMPQIKQLCQYGNLSSYKQLLLSWYDRIYHIPLSFPMLKDGKLQNQKNFNSQRSVICVEIMKEEILSMPKNARFLHIHLAKIECEQIIEDEKQKQKQNHKISISFWPNDNHMRIIYAEKEAKEKDININRDKITYKNLSAFICKKYNILSANLLIAMFKINRGEWLIIDDSNDATQQGLHGAPFHITKTNRDGQIFAIADLSQSKTMITMQTIKESIALWPVPPLSNKARFHFKHFNQTNTTSINDISKGITSSASANKNSSSYNYDRQLKITNID